MHYFLLHITITTILLLSLINPSTQTPQDLVDISKIKQFPSDASYTAQIYAGYLNITYLDKAFFYMLYKSQSGHDSDPLILWLNGGPGCSSMIGMVSQNGPFIFVPQTNKMVVNKYAWNLNAHVIYLQSPAGVGFSKGKRQSLIASDTSVAQDNYIAMLRFFEKFPYLKDNDFYIAGESYAGIYIPRLAQQIILNNQQQSALDRKMNLKGVLIGNGCTHPFECYTATTLSRFQVEFYYTRGFVDPTTYSQYISACVNSGNEKSADCQAIQTKINNDFKASKANVYNVYGVCYPVPTTKLLLQGASDNNQNIYGNEQKQYLKSFGKYMKQMIERQQNGQNGNLKYALRCSDMVGPNSLFNTYQNRQFLHVESRQTLEWTPCATLNYTIESSATYYNIPNLVKYGLKIHYFSGDFDAMVPIQGTLWWLKKYRSDFGASVKKSWRPWAVDANSKTIGGMIWQLDGITFWSVAGAGHMVPTDKPVQAKFILDVFLGLNNIEDYYANPDQRNRVISQEEI